MKFRSVEIENFKSFNGRHTFDFGEHGAGLHFLTGRNEVEDGLGANGAGKSTFWDAIIWTLYGRSGRGLRAGNICTWGPKATVRGVVEICLRDTERTITRTWNPNKLSLDDRELTQEELDVHLGLSFESFQQSIIIGQFSRMFFDMSATEKLTLFSEVLNLQRWVGFSDVARGEKKDVDADGQSKERSLSKIYGKVETLEDQIEAAKESEESWEESKQEKLKEFQRHIHDLEEEISDLEEQAIDYSVKIKKNEVEMEPAYRNAVDATAELAKIELDPLNDEMHSAIENKRRWEEDLKEYKLLGKSCPVCEQDIPESFRDVALMYRTGELASAEKREDKAIEAFDLAEERAVELEDVAMRCQADVKYFEEENETYKRKKASIGDRLRTLDSEATRQERSMGGLAKTEFAGADLIKKNEEDLSQLKQESAQLLIAIEDLDAIHAALEYWVKGFKDIRLYQIKEALVQLEIEVNSNLHALGLEGWRVGFDVERATTTGGVSKGFQVVIHSPHNEDPVPWEAWSGGESQRLRLAGTMGLANLILDSHGIESNIEVFDEPSAHLSTSGIEDLADLLYSRAHTLQKQVWLVDHRTIDYGGFSSVVTVVKDSDGSHLDVQKTTGE